MNTCPGPAPPQTAHDPDLGWCPECAPEPDEHELCSLCRDGESLFRCPQCYRMSHWTDGTLDPPELWCQVCGHEFDPLPHQVPSVGADRNTT